MILRRARRPLPRAASVIFAIGAASAGCASAGPRDVVAESRDVREVDKGAGARGDGYAYVARRPLGIVALAEARGIDDADARRAVDHLADALDACATDLGQKGQLVDGAVRVVAQVAPDGSVAGLNVKVGQVATATAILCVIAPLKLTSFPADQGGAGARANAGGDAGVRARGLAIEATWGSPHPLR